VELTAAGSALLERARLALAEVDLAVDDARRAARSDPGVLAVGYAPFSRSLTSRLVEAVADERPGLRFRLEEGVAQELVGRVATHELVAAVALELPAAARRSGVRVDALRDEPLLAALSRRGHGSPRRGRVADPPAGADRARERLSRSGSGFPPGSDFLFRPRGA
jgi:LysR family hca operon transcriptional activator